MKRLAPIVALVAALAATVPNAPGADPPRCVGKPATIVGSGVVHGTARADVIVTGAGPDRVDGRGGNDWICTGPGDDLVEGGIGSDQIVTHNGDDRVEGGNGSDGVAAGAGQDVLIGGRGNDQLQAGTGDRDLADGGLGDDTASGDAGDFDQVIGGIGNDRLYGGEGKGDLVRGDRGGDTVDGGNGEGDTVSFAVSGAAGTIFGGSGVNVDLGAGTSTGDGDDQIEGIEDVVGTPFSDLLKGDEGPNVLYGGGGPDVLLGSGPGDSAFGGLGRDACHELASVDSCEEDSTRVVPPFPVPGVVPSAKLEVDLAGGPAASSLSAVVNLPGMLREGPGISARVSFDAGAWVVDEGQIPIEVGDRCALVAPSQARCPVPGSPDAVMLNGSGGDDRLEIDPAVPPTVSAFIVGDVGSDLVVGGEGDDNLTGGPGDGSSARSDVVLGRGGEDSLTQGVVLRGGAGSDLLISSVCGGDEVDGGIGVDSVSFARVTSAVGIEATIGGTAGFAPYETKRGPVPGGCGSGEHALVPTVIDRSVESIEGSPGNDVLHGDGAANILLGRAGDDQIFGAGGDDFLVGGTGRDALIGEAGADRLYAQDGFRDAGIDCGPGPRDGGVARVDPSDPPAACTVLGAESSPERVGKCARPTRPARSDGAASGRCRRGR